jgi:PAS domain S-box-containing protein
VLEVFLAGKPLADHSDEVRTILDAAPFPLLISRVSDGTVLYANDNLGAYVNVKAAELIGKKTPDFYANPNDRQALLEEVKRAGRVSNYELRLRESGGHERWALASVVATRLRGEDVLVAGLNDITDRKAVEDSLRQSEQRFRSLVENANDIIYLLTPDGVFTYVSPNWTDVLGHEVSEIVGTNFAPRVHPDDIDRCYVFLNTVLETGEKQSGIEYRVKHKDGSWRWHTSNASSLEDNEGNVMNFVGIARDITEKKRAQLDLEHAHRELREKEVQLVQSERMAALGRLVRGVAHEINSPIGAIRSMRNTLSAAVAKLQKHLGEAAPEPMQDRTLDVILGTILDADRVIGQGAERITEIVNSLRSFTRLDEADLKECDIHEGIDSTLTLIDHELKGRVEVLREYGEFGPIVCYPRRLNQVFLNILRNASQAIDGQGRMTIRTFEAGNEIRVAIQDTG